MNTSDAAVAVVGISFELPGCADWTSLSTVLRTGQDCVRPLPVERANDTGVASEGAYQPGGWITDITGFDHQYFGLSLAEAELIDPRQRRMLQLALRAIGEAGYSPKELRGHNVAVLVAGYGGLDPTLLDLLPEAERHHGPAVVGSTRAFAAGRIAYHLDLRGSAQVIDTACSSFLVALHEARWKVARGEADFALVGGYELMLGRPPKRSDGTDGLGVLSPTGRCRPFDEKADGTTFGEGGGFVLLKRLDAALRDGDLVHAVIRGTAVNQDAGQSNGLTAPSPRAQEQVITAALDEACVHPSSVGYVEAHGTGTKIGDPIEFQALTAAFSKSKTAVPVSSVKGNFGHLDGMAGFAGLARILAQFRAGEIFPTAHFTSPNPLLGLSGTPLRIVAGSELWPEATGPRRACISGFGLSGTNAHAVLEQAAPVTATQRSVETRVVVLSAQTEEGLREYAGQLANSNIDVLGETADVLAIGREQFRHRQAWVVRDTAELVDRVASLASGSEAVVRADIPAALAVIMAEGSSPDLVELYALAEVYPSFADVLAEAARHLRASQWSAAQRQLIRLVGEGAVLADLDLEPNLVLAHGAATLAASCARGAMPLSEAIDAVVHKNATPADADRVRAALGGLGDGALVIDLTPDSSLSRLVRAEVPADRYVTSSSTHELLRQLHLAGYGLDWRRVLGRSPARRVELPIAPLAEVRCWPTSISPAHGEELTEIAAEPSLQTPAEFVLRLAREALKEPRLKLDDDFLDFGGNSLTGAQLMARINDRFGLDFDVLDLFDPGSLRTIADAATNAAPVESLPSAPPGSEPAVQRSALSGQQVAILAACQLAPDSAAYHVSGGFLFESGMDERWLTTRLTEIVRRHPMLRTSLRDTTEGTVQVVAPAETTSVVLQRVHLRFPEVTAARGRETLLTSLRELVGRPLPFLDEVPSRYQLVHAEFADRTEHVLVMTFHHLFFDGWSWRVLMDELCDGERPAPTRTYLDFVRDQKTLLNGARGRELDKFWDSALGGVPTLTLPTDHPNADLTMLPGPGTELPLRLDAQVVEDLGRLARRHRSTLNMVLLAAWMTMLWRITGVRDVCVSSAVAARTPADEGVIGCYANTIGIRVQLRPDQSFETLLATVREAQLAALAHGELPANRLLRLARPLSAEPLATTNWTYQSDVEPMRRMGPGHTAVELLDIEPEAAPFPLAARVLGYGDQLLGGVRYATEFFRLETVLGWIQEYQTMVHRLSRHGGTATLYELLGQAEKPAEPLRQPDFTF